MRRMTAKEAKTLSDYSNVESRVDELLSFMKMEAEKGKTSLDTGNHLEISDFWERAAASNTQHFKKAAVMLEDLGYIVKYFNNGRGVGIYW